MPGAGSAEAVIEGHRVVPQLISRLQTPDLSRRLSVTGVVSSVVLGVDLLTKRWAALTFADEPRPILDPVLTFTYTENAGSAFNLIEGGAILGLAAVVAVAVVIAAVWSPRPTVEVVGLALIGGGAIGNLIDRLARGDGVLDGRVIDWIQFPNFPVFNIADSALTVGVALLLVSAWRRPELDRD